MQQEEFFVETAPIAAGGTFDSDPFTTKQYQNLVGEVRTDQPGTLTISQGRLPTNSFVPQSVALDLDAASGEYVKAFTVPSHSYHAKFSLKNDGAAPQTFLHFRAAGQAERGS